VPGWRSLARQIADPLPSPSLAAAEDEPSWLVQFDRLAVRLPERSALAPGPEDNSSAVGLNRRGQPTRGRCRAIRPIVQGEGGRVGTRRGCDPTPKEMAVAARAAGSMAAAHLTVGPCPKPEPVPDRRRPRGTKIGRGGGPMSATRVSTRSAGTGLLARKLSRRPMASTADSKSWHAWQATR